MSRLLLVGRGPLPAPDQQRTGFAQLRTAHFLTALRGAGHAVDLLLVEQDDQPGLVERGRHLARAADAIVSAGPHRPGALAALIAGDRPWWGDIPGDPFAELQAIATAPGGAVSAQRVAAAQAAAVAVLTRADHLSVVSQPQAHAALGQLGLLGRIVEVPAPLSVVPIAYDLPIPRQPPRSRAASDPLVMVLSGAVAPWLDDQTLAHGLDLALTEDRRLQLVLTGGGVPGHYTAGAERLATWARQSPHHGRIRNAGWVEHQALDGLLSQSHVGLCLDRPGAEPQLGSRTRLLLYAWSGLHIATSTACELAGELASDGCATHLPMGDARGVADRLLALPDRTDLVDHAHQAHAHLLDRYAPARVAAPLVKWAGRPSRHPPARPPAAELGEQVEQLRAEIASIHASPTWRTLNRLHLQIRALVGRNR